MSLKSTQWRFWVVSLATLLTVALTTSLTVWQLSRAAQKEALAQQRAEREGLPALGWADLQELNADTRAGRVNRMIELQGQWMHEATVYLDNRPLKGRAGFLVLTPLLADDGATAVLVVRGWVPRRLDDRTALPVLDEVREQVWVRGRLAPPPSKLYDFGQPGQGLIRQNIDLDAFGAEWSIRLGPVTVQQLDSDAADAGLSRDWPQPDSDVHKHYGYAFQWFSLTVLLLILYVWFQFIAPRKRRID